MCEYVHIPVLANEVLGFMKPSTTDVFIDATMGLGGHSKLFLEHGATVYGIDADRRNLERARELLGQYAGKQCDGLQNDEPHDGGPRAEEKSSKIKSSSVHFINDNFENIGAIAEDVKKKEGRLDGILFDLGISSVHVDDPERGFSFLRNGPLDMRLNPDQSLTASEVVNEFSEEKLKEIIETNGDERFAHRIAYNIVQYRSHKRFETTVELADFIAGVMHSRNGFYAKRALINGEWPDKERQRVHEWALRQHRHPATRTFQALRIAVNREIEVLKSGLVAALEALDSCGRLAVITFHSIEDRIVKNIFKTAALTKQYMLYTKKPIEPTPEEISQNPRSRSAKLRGIVRREPQPR